MQVSNQLHVLVYPHGKSPQCLWNRRLGEPQSKCWSWWKRKEQLPLPGFKSIFPGFPAHNLFNIVASIPDCTVSPLIYSCCFSQNWNRIAFKTTFSSQWFCMMQDRYKFLYLLDCCSIHIHIFFSPTFSFPILHCSNKNISFILR